MRVYVQEYIPGVRCGWHTCEVKSKGPKWVKVKFASKTQCKKIRRQTWDKISPQTS